MLIYVPTGRNLGVPIMTRLLAKFRVIRNHFQLSESSQTRMPTMVTVTALHTEHALDEPICCAIGFAEDGAEPTGPQKMSACGENV